MLVQEIIRVNFSRTSYIGKDLKSGTIYSEEKFHKRYSLTNKNDNRFKSIQKKKISRQEQNQYYYQNYGNLPVQIIQVRSQITSFILPYWNKNNYNKLKQIQYLRRQYQSLQHIIVHQKVRQEKQRQALLDSKVRQLKNQQDLIRKRKKQIEQKQMLLDKKNKQLLERQNFIEEKLKSIIKSQNSIDQYQKPQQYIQYYLDPTALKFFRANFQLKSSLQLTWKSVIVKGVKQKRCDIKQLDLRSTDQFKLADKVQQLTKVNLPHVQKLNIQNNLIKDEGLQILCQKGSFPALQTVNLEDNGITISGVSTLIHNKWDQKVNYQLTSVQQKNGALRVHVGEHIPLMKNIIESKTVSEIDKVLPKFQQNKKLNALNLLLVTPLEKGKQQEQVKQSKKLMEQYVAGSQKSQISVSHLMVALKKRIGDPLKFTTKTGTKTNLTSKILFSGMIQERIKFSHKFENLQHFKFSDFKGKHQKIKEFETWYFNYLKNQYGVDTSDMTIDSIVQGSIVVHASDSSTKMFGQNQKYLSKVSDQVKIFFESLHLNQNQFDFNKNFDFPKKIKGDSIQKRGGLPYYQPILGRRFGISVSGLYNDKNWLLMDGNKGQWAIAFHGINNPAEIVKNDKNQDVKKIRSIMDGRLQGIMLREGKRQALQSHKCLKSNQLVGRGVYVSPYFLTCLLDYTQTPADSYHIVLQCRVRPASIKISESRTDYWVINKRDDLRPYGIIIFTDAQFNELKKMGVKPQIIHKQLYGAEFTSQTWKKNYSEEYKKFHS